MTDNPHLFPADLVSTCEIARLTLLWVIVDSSAARINTPAQTKFYQLVLSLRKVLKEKNIKEPTDVV